MTTPRPLPTKDEVMHRQVTVSAGRIERFGLTWEHGSRFQYRHWLALRLIDKDAARLYFRTTH